MTNEGKWDKMILLPMRKDFRLRPLKRSGILGKAFKHFMTITRHRHQVIRHCYRAGILFRGLLHDLSKYSFAEFSEGMRFYDGSRSPNVGARMTRGYSKAWMHHKGRNRHHFEYWTDYDPVTRVMRPVKMPLRFVAEMFCDRVAASKIYNGAAYRDGDPLSYFLSGKPTRQIHAETSDFLEKLLRMLADEGEEKTFSYLRECVKSGKDY